MQICIFVYIWGHNCSRPTCYISNESLWNKQFDYIHHLDNRVYYIYHILYFIVKPSKKTGEILKIDARVTFNSYIYAKC